MTTAIANRREPPALWQEKGVPPVSALYDMRIAIENKIKADGLDATKVKGEIGLRTGRLVSLISPASPDDPVIIAKFKVAAKEVLNLSL